MYKVIIANAGRHDGERELNVDTWERAVVLGESYRKMMISVGHPNARVMVEDGAGRKLLIP